MPKSGAFKFVYIPADPSEPLEELSQEYTEENNVQCLLDRLKAHFSAHKPAKTSEQAARQQAQLLANVPEEHRGQVSAQLLANAADLGMVESVALLGNTRDNGFMGVNLYCDDEATFVDAPLNRRASDIAGCCGKPLEVRGDAFLARVFDNENEFERLDFTLREMSSSAPWVKEAARQNEAKRKADSAQSVLARMQQQQQQQQQQQRSAPEQAPAAPRVVELSPAEAEKESGNAAFRKSNWAEAVARYTAAIELDGSLAAAYSNRALARLKLGEAAAAETDCDHALLLQPQNVKALLRRGAARELLQRPGEALEDFKSVLQIEPGNKEARQKVEHLTQLELDVLS